MQHARLADGRILEYLEVGDPVGRPVVYMHGTPNTAGSVALFDDTARRLGLRLVAVSRPGYGASTTTPPGLLSVGRDVGEVADAVGLGDFAVLGVSGGGPFAFAIAAGLPTRVGQVLVAAGSGPYHLLQPEVLEPADLQALELLATGDADGAVAAVLPGVARDFDPMRGLPLGEFEEAFAAMTPPNERYLDDHPSDRTRFFADVHRALERYDGFIRDNLSWLGTWDVDLGHVVAPVQLSYGAADGMVSPVHGEWLERRLPTATLTVHADAGHGEVTMGLVEWLLGTLD